MGIKALKTLDGYLNYETSGNGTLMQSFQELIESEHAALKNIVDGGLWQPGTNYAAGAIIQSPSMVPNTVAKVKSAGVSGAEEPTWTELGTIVVDNGVTYSIIQKTIEMATVSDIETGTDVILAVTPKALADFIKKVYENAKGAASGIATLDANKVLVEKVKYDASGNVIPDTYATKDGLTGAIDGIAVFSGATDTTASNKGLVPVAAAGDQKKFFRGDGNWSTVENEPVKAVYTAPGACTWICPAGVTMVLVTVIGAGGGGAGGCYITKGFGGGGGNIIRDYPIAVTSGANYTVVVGAGGAAGGVKTNDDTAPNGGSDGGQSSFGSLVAKGGAGGGQNGGNGALSLSSGTNLNNGTSDGAGGGQFGGNYASSQNNSASTGGVGSGGGSGYSSSQSWQRTAGGAGGPGMVIIKY